jgi:ParB-like chromosome segregation protein Spo0J
MSALVKENAGLPVHDVANLFPMMSDDEYRALVKDIRENGLREAIWLYEGKIIDGRNRYKACRELGVEPDYQQWNGEGSIINFVISLNLHRRHLSSSQKAVIALEVEKFLSVEAKERQRGGQGGVLLSQKIEQANPGKATEQAAKLIGTNRQYVSDAKVIEKKAPQALVEIKAGKATIPDVRQHIAAVEKYPELVVIPTRKDAVTVAKNLDAIPEERRTEVRQKLANHDQNVLAELAEKPPMREREFSVGESPGERWSKGLVKVSQIFMSLTTHGGIKKLVSSWTEREKKIYHKKLCDTLETLTNLKEDLENELSQDA